MNPSDSITHDNANANPSINNPVSVSNGNEVVDGMNIFWILLAFALSSSFHSLGSAPGFPAGFTRYFRILPLCSLFDLAALYIEFIQQWSPLQRCREKHHSSLHRTSSSLQRFISYTSMLVSSARSPAREVAIRRLSRNRNLVPDDRENPTITTTPFRDDGVGSDAVLIIGRRLKTSFAISSLLDFWPRLFANVGLIFAYTKICGFTNVPISTALATLYFRSWLGMELFLYIAFGLGIGSTSGSRSVLHRRELEDDSPIAGRNNNVGSSRPHEKTLRVAGFLLVSGQIMALLVVFIVAAASLEKEREQEKQDDAMSPLLDLILWYPIVANVFVYGADLFQGTVGNMLDIMQSVIDWIDGDSFLNKAGFTLVVLFGGPLLVLGFYAVGLLILFLALCICLFLAMFPFIVVQALYLYGHLVPSPLLVRWEKVETWAECVGVRRWHLFFKAAVGVLIAGCLIFFNIFFDGRQTGKEEWTGKLD